jgi:hypothetical protein
MAEYGFVMGAARGGREGPWALHAAVRATRHLADEHASRKDGLLGVVHDGVHVVGGAGTPKGGE